VLYELLTGLSLFAGPTVSDTMAAVLKTEPDISPIPLEVRPIIERCLRKDPRRRWRDIAVVRLALEEGPPAAPVPMPRRRVLPWTIAAALAVVAAGSAWLT